MLLTTVLMLVGLDMALAIAFHIRDSRGNVITRKYGVSAAQRAGANIWSFLYPTLSSAEVDTLLKETWNRRVEFEPYTGFREAPFRGRYVNVDNHGFRQSKGQSPWPPRPDALNVFFFGGSTTFGYGVPDEDTVPSAVQDILSREVKREVHVYNFGRGYYFSTQERILYEQLLIRGFTPDVAVFIDGINDFYYSYQYDQPEFSSAWRAFVNGSAAQGIAGYILSDTSLGRAAASLRRRLMDRTSAADTNMALRPEDAAAIDSTVRRYISTKHQIETISHDKNVKLLFVWQPSPAYNYDQKYHAFPVSGYRETIFPNYGYRRMREVSGQSIMGANFLWAADMQATATKPLYVDQYHYSPAFSKEFAAVIAARLLSQLSPKS